MRYRNLGSSGLVVSVLGVGCNAFGARTDADEVDAIVGDALEQGITLFDTADTYSAGESERLLGAALQGRRDRAVVATKFGMPVTEDDGPDGLARGSRRYVRQAVEASLRRLGTDRIDLLQMHTPDRATPLEETLEALDDLVREGKVLYIGSSNRSAWEVAHADGLARALGTSRFVSVQDEYSLYNRSAEAELLPACEELGIGVLPYFPLAYGLLTGKYRRGAAAPEGSRLAESPQRSRLESADFDTIDALQAFADARGVPLLHVAIGALAARPVIGSVISGVSRREQIASNIAALEWEPSAEDLAELAAIGPDRRPQGYTPFAS